MDKIQKIDNQEGRGVENNIAIGKDGPFWIYAIIGSRGSGKSTIVLNLLKGWLKKYYDEIFLVSTTAHMDDKFRELIDELKEDDRYFGKFSEAILQQIGERIEEFNDKHKHDGGKPYRSLVVLDDCISMLPKSTEKSSFFNKFIVGSRHYKTDIIITSQKFNKLNTLIRGNLDIISMFPTVNKKEIKAYLEELNVDEDKFAKLLGGFQDRHDFLTINFLGNRARFFKKFELIS